MSQENQGAMKCAHALTARSIDQKLDQLDNDAAAHIRRLVAENEALLEDLRKFREAASCERDLRQEQERHAAALVQQMLEALEQYTTPSQRLDGSPCREPINKSLCTAAREWLGQKGETK